MKLNRLVLVLALAIVAILGLAVSGALRAPLQRMNLFQERLPVGGRLALPADQGVLLFDLATREERLVVPVPPGQLVTAVDWSPDQQLIAYGFFHRRTGDPASVSEIYVANADGSDSRVLAERDRPGVVLDTPVWTPDGKSVLFSYFGQVEGKVVQRVESVDLGSGERRIVVESGYGPDVSSDGQLVLFLRDERSGMGLWAAPLAGGEPRSVISPGRYSALAAPRLSPDGSHVAVAIINLTSAARSDSPWDWLIGGAAYAHGNPWDIWTFDLNGGDAHRLTNLNADDPSVTWSPDGAYLALWSGSGLFMVGADGAGLRKVGDRLGYGSLDWVR